MRYLFIVSLLSFCSILSAGQDYTRFYPPKAQPVKIELNDCNAENLSNSTWYNLSYNLYEKSPDRNLRLISVLSFEDKKSGFACYQSDFTEEFLADTGIVFAWHPKEITIKSKISKDVFNYNTSSYLLDSIRRTSLLLLNYRSRRTIDTNHFYTRSKIIALLNDTLLVLTPPNSIFRAKDGNYYSFQYETYINSKHANDISVKRRFSTFSVSEDFVCGGIPVITNCDADTLKLNVENWIQENIKMPKNYGGIVEEGKIKFSIIFDKKGFVNTISFVNKLDEELNNHLITELKKMPSVGTLIDHHDTYHFNYNQHETKQTFTCFFKR